MLYGFQQALYKRRIICGQFICTWADIEKVIFDKESIRLVNKYHGAEIFLLGRNKTEKLKPIIEKLFNERFDK